jgi:hypothetical protein
MRVAPDSAALELGIPLGAEAKSDGASVNLDALLDGGAVSESAGRAETFIHLADFVRVGKGQFQRQGSAAVDFEKADICQPLQNIKFIQMRCSLTRRAAPKPRSVPYFQIMVDDMSKST